MPRQTAEQPNRSAEAATAAGARQERAPKVVSAFEATLSELGRAKGRKVVSTSMHVELTTAPSKAGQKPRVINYVVTRVNVGKDSYYVLATQSGDPRAVAKVDANGQTVVTAARADGNAKRVAEAGEQKAMVGYAVKNAGMFVNYEKPAEAASATATGEKKKAKKAKRARYVAVRNFKLSFDGRNYSQPQEVAASVRTVGAKEKPFLTKVLSYKSREVKGQKEGQRAQREARNRQATAAAVLQGMNEYLKAHYAQVDDATRTDANRAVALVRDGADSIVVRGVAGARRGRNNGKVEFGMYRVVLSADRRTAVGFRRVSAADFTPNGKEAKNATKVAEYAARLVALQQALEQKFPTVAKQARTGARAGAR